MKQLFGCGFGICQNNHLDFEWPSFLCKGFAYGYCNKKIYSKNVEASYNPNDDQHVGFILERNEVIIKTNDTVEMKLDMIRKILTIKIKHANDEEDVLEISDIDSNENLKYRMAIYIHGTGNKIELMEYREYSS